MGIQNTTARETQTAAEALERAKSQLRGEWGWRGDRGEGQAAWWVVGHVWAWSRKGGRQKGGKPGSKEHATGKADMPVRASAAPFQVAGLRTLPKLGGEGPAQCTSTRAVWTAELTLTGMSRVGVGVTDYTGATNTSGSRRPTASHKTSGSTQGGAEETLEARWGPRPTVSLPVLFPGQSTSAELRASGGGRERARRPGRWKTREGALDGKEGRRASHTMTRTFSSFPGLILAFFPMWRRQICYHCYSEIRSSEEDSGCVISYHSAPQPFGRRVFATSTQLLKEHPTTHSGDAAATNSAHTITRAGKEAGDEQTG